MSRDSSGSCGILSSCVRRIHIGTRLTSRMLEGVPGYQLPLGGICLRKGFKHTYRVFLCRLGLW